MSDHPSSSKNSNMQWMYEGTKSIVNREDYLLGKKIDRNFELYSDVVVKDKEEEAREDFFKKKLLHNGNQKISALDVRTVRNEDPLVALKFQEEQRRRQMLENPLLKLKAQKILQKEFEKQMKKKEKKLKKKHKKSRTSSSDEETPKKQNKRRDERSRSKEYIERPTRSRDDERSLHNKRKEERDSSSNRHHHHHKDLSSHSAERKREHLEEERTHSHSKLTAAEMEERRKAMLQNASWRDEMRENNFKMTAEQLKKEETETKNVPTFMRPVIDSANESVEKRLQSNKMAVQRSHDHMEKSFIRR